MTEPIADDLDFDLHAMYRIYDGFGRPLYFGETNNLPRRLAEHMEKAWFRRPDITIKVTWFPNRAEAFAAQNRAIAAEKPWYNKAGLTASKAPLTVAPKPKAVKPHDLLADLDAMLGSERERLAELPSRLRALAPDWEPYRSLNGMRLREQLTQRGVRTTNTRNVPQLNPADLRVVLKKAG